MKFPDLTEGTSVTLGSEMREMSDGQFDVAVIARGLLSVDDARKMAEYLRAVVVPAVKQSAADQVVHELNATGTGPLPDFDALIAGEIASDLTGPPTRQGEFNDRVLSVSRLLMLAAEKHPDRSLTVHMLAAVQFAVDIAVLRHLVAPDVNSYATLADKFQKVADLLKGAAQAVAKAAPAQEAAHGG